MKKRNFSVKYKALHGLLEPGTHNFRNGTKIVVTKKSLVGYNEKGQIVMELGEIDEPKEIIKKPRYSKLTPSGSTKKTLELDSVDELVGECKCEKLKNGGLNAHGCLVHPVFVNASSIPPSLRKIGHRNGNKTNETIVHARGYDCGLFNCTERKESWKENLEHLINYHGQHNFEDKELFLFVESLISRKRQELLDEIKDKDVPVHYAEDGGIGRAIPRSVILDFLKGK